MKYLILLIFVLPCMNVIATEQIQDIIYLDYKKFEIEEQPLGNHPKVNLVIKKIEPKKCTASWRGYQAFWRITKEKLYLIYIKNNPCDSSESGFIPEELLAERESKDFTTWYSGKITIRTSNRTFLTKAVDGVDGEKYEAIVYKIEKGKVLSRDIEKIEYHW